jgi:hypothetical protein
MPKPSFHDVYRCLEKHGSAAVRSSRGTNYRVYPEWRKGEPAIVGYPRSGEVVVHEDCWGDPLTCRGTRAGGIFHGNPSIYDWYAMHCGKSSKSKP